MKKLFVMAVLLGLTAVITPSAQALIIDFEDLQTRNNFYDMGIENSYLGYNWAPAGTSTGWASAYTGYRVSGETIVPVSGTAYGWNWNGPQSLFIDFGAATDVNSAYFANLGSSYSENSSSIQLFGYDAGNNLLASSTVLALTDSFQLLNANLSNVYSLEIRADRDYSWFLVDDISINEAQQNSNAVPEPASILLLGSGLVGFAFRKKK